MLTARRLGAAPTSRLVPDCERIATIGHCRSASIEFVLHGTGEDRQVSATSARRRAAPVGRKIGALVAGMIAGRRQHHHRTANSPCVSPRAGIARSSLLRCLATVYIAIPIVRCPPTVTPYPVATRKAR